jgi:hypothetical protein
MRVECKGQFWLTSIPARNLNEVLDDLYFYLNEQETFVNNCEYLRILW